MLAELDDDDIPDEEDNDDDENEDDDDYGEVMVSTNLLSFMVTLNNKLFRTSLPPQLRDHQVLIALGSREMSFLPKESFVRHVIDVFTFPSPHILM